jgi:hypothetical protein
MAADDHAHGQIVNADDISNPGLPMEKRMTWRLMQP